jgi:hypothetical protein
MSYYVVPKIKAKLQLSIATQNTNELPIYISKSSLDHYNETKSELVKTCINDCIISYSDIIKLLNPYESIREYNLDKSIIFFELFEILNRFELLSNSNISVLHLTPNYLDTVDSFRHIRKQHSDSHYTLENSVKYDFIYYESNSTTTRSYVFSMLRILQVIHRTMKLHGSCVIKITNVIYKPILEALYILSSMFDKVYIFKPDASNVFTHDKYIICSNLIVQPSSINNIYTNKHITSLLSVPLPIMFVNRVNEINVMICKRQLEFFDQAINCLKSKYKFDKIEQLINTNVSQTKSYYETYHLESPNVNNAFTNRRTFDNACL